MPEIYTHKTDTMRRILHLVSHGYSHYCHGQVSSKKVAALNLKFSDRYQIHATEMQRYRAKKKGLANTYLILYGQGENPTLLYWWLLVTPGEGLVWDLETLQDATEKRQRITWPTGDYEFVKTPRKQLPAAWTWRMTPATITGWGSYHIAAKSAIFVRKLVIVQYNQ